MAKAVPSVTLSFSAATVADLNRVLNPKQVRTAMYQAVVRTTRRAKTIATKAVQERLTIPRKYIDDEKNRHSAIRARVDRSGESPEGRLTIAEKQLPLSAFKYRQRKGGVTVIVDKGSPPLIFRHAFAARVRSKRQEELGVSHTGVFMRQRLSAAKADRYFQKGSLSRYRAAKGNRITPAGYAWRLPIQELFGPTILDFISRGEIRAAVLRDIGNELYKQLDSQVSRFTKGRHSSLEQAMSAAATAGQMDSTDTDATNA